MVPKPAPDQVVRACARLGVEPSSSVMVGDSTWDEAAALAAGASFIGLTNGRASEFGSGTPLAEDLNEVLGHLASA